METTPPPVFGEPIVKDPNPINASPSIRQVDAAYLRRWDRALLVTTWVYTVLGAYLLLLLADSNNRFYHKSDGRINGPSFFIPALVILIASLLWIGRALYKGKSRDAAISLYMVAGVLGVPLGLLVLNAAKRLTTENTSFEIPQDGNLSWGPAFGIIGFSCAGVIAPVILFASPLAFMIVYAVRGFLDGNLRRGIQALIVFGVPFVWLIAGFTFRMPGPAMLAVILPPILLLILRFLPVPRPATRAAELLANT